MIDDVESLLALGVIDAANVDQTSEAAAAVVAQEPDDLGNVATLDRDGELAERDLRACELRSERVAEIGGELVKGVVHHGSNGT